MSDEKNKRKFVDFRFVRNERRQGNILACILFWSVLAFFFFRTCLFFSVEVVGASMQPTLHHGDRHLLHRWTRYVRPLQRGDVVAIDLKRDGDYSVKRIVALPGETIQLTQAGVAVDGRQLPETYLPSGTATIPNRFGYAPLTLGEDEYFVMGDNRPNSEDSRHHGPVPRESVLGVIHP
jgi:signal peptidase I